jgi:hypothetical protein
MATLPALMSAAVYRRARRTYACDCPGGSAPEPHCDCRGHIEPGDRYVEYFGETPAYQSGLRYCLPCGVDTWNAARWDEAGPDGPDDVLEHEKPGGLRFETGPTWA